MNIHKWHSIAPVLIFDPYEVIYKSGDNERIVREHTTVVLLALVDRMCLLRFSAAICAVTSSGSDVINYIVFLVHTDLDSITSIIIM